MSLDSQPLPSELPVEAVDRKYAKVPRAIMVRNIAYNWSLVVVTMISGIITVPILINRLGDVNYGMWIIIGALAGYFQFFDFGLRGSIGRHVAFYDAKHDQPDLNRTMSTALALLCGVSLMALVSGLAVTWFFPQFLEEVPTHRVWELRVACLIIVADLSLGFFWRAFDAFLWGLQRFDLLNFIDIPTLLLRLALTVLLVYSEEGLITLAWITLLTNFVGGLAKMALGFRERPLLSIRRSFISMHHAKELFTFGIWQLFSSLAMLSRKSLIPVVIGVSLGVASLVPFSIATRLVDVAGMFLMTAVGVVAPVSTMLHARKDHRQQQELFIVGLRFCSCLSLFFAAGFILLGRETISLWVGPDYAYASRYLTIFSLGMILPLATSPSDSLFVGLAKPRLQAMFYISDAIVCVVAAYLLGRYGHLEGVCLAIAISTTLSQGIVRPIIAARCIGMSPTGLFVQSFVPALAVSVVPIGVLWYIVQVHPPHSFTWLFAQGGLYGLLTLLCIGLGMLGPAAILRRVSAGSR